MLIVDPHRFPQVVDFLSNEQISKSRNLMETSASLESCNGQSPLNYSASLGWAEPKTHGLCNRVERLGRDATYGQCAVTGDGSQLSDKVASCFKLTVFLTSGRKTIKSPQPGYD